MSVHFDQDRINDANRRIVPNALLQPHPNIVPVNHDNINNNNLPRGQPRPNFNIDVDIRPRHQGHNVHVAREPSNEPVGGSKYKHRKKSNRFSQKGRRKSKRFSQKGRRKSKRCCRVRQFSGLY
jgi:hypothetical protein